VRRAESLRLILWLSIGPVLALLALDRAVVCWDAHWAWAAREVPPLTLDPYRLEATLRSTPPGRRNVVILGNSVAEMGFDREALESRFRAEGLRFPKLTIGGAPAASFGMLARAVAGLEPRTVVYVAAAPALRSRDFLDHVYSYDVRAAPALFTPAEWLAEPRFHLEGLAGQLHVLARHRRALQRALLVRLGRLSWEGLRLQAERIRLEHGLEGRDAFQEWVSQEPDRYPNPNTRALAHLARTLRAAGASLVVLDAPVHPILMKLGIRERVARYRSLLRELAEAEGFAWLDAEQLPRLAEHEFLDWIHANDRGRERLTGFLGDHLAAGP